MLSLSRAGNFRMVDIRINALTLNLFLKILEPVVSVFEIVYNPSFSNFIWTNFKLTVAKCTMYTVKPVITNTSKEFIKCRILHFLIMECCRYLVFYLNDYMELFKTVPAYSWLFIYFRKYWNLRNIQWNP